MDFGDAIRAMKRGAKVARRGWNGKGMWLCIPLCDGPKEIPAEKVWGKPNADYANRNGGTVKVMPYITMKAADGSIVMGWLASQTDMLSEDWVVVNDFQVIRLEAGVRYPEDGYVNGVEDNSFQPKMPFLVRDEESFGYRWNLNIDIETGKIENWPINVTAKVQYKVCDECRIKFGDKTYDDYVPEWLGIEGKSNGDYIILSIEDGRIKNWPAADCKGFIRNVLGEYY